MSVGDCDRAYDDGVEGVCEHSLKLDSESLADEFLGLFISGNADVGFPPIDFSRGFGGPDPLANPTRLGIDMSEMQVESDAVSVAVWDAQIMEVMCSSSLSVVV